MDKLISMKLFTEIIDTGSFIGAAEKLDISKARSRLNWHPALNLKQALQLIVDWSQARSSGVDMQQFTSAQIKSYQALTAE